MKTITVKDTLSLSVAERIVLVEEIWDSIAAEIEDSQPFSEPEKKIIDQRLASYKEKPDQVSSWETVYDRIVNPK